MIQRTPEPELMTEAEQARAYSEADFTAPHEHFVDLCENSFSGRKLSGAVLDLGCGPADVTLRFARRFPNCTVVGVDGSEAMLSLGRERIRLAANLRERIELIHETLPGPGIPNRNYQAIISNSLLHHLHDPQVLWSELRRQAQPGTLVFVMDLTRPDSIEAARQLKEQYAANEPPVLQRDFYNSLLAAFTPDEVREQLKKAGLSQLKVEQASDRHIIIHGVISN